MKKINFLLFMFLCLVSYNQVLGQDCAPGTIPFPSAAVVAPISETVTCPVPPGPITQSITTCAFETEFSTVDLDPAETYEFAGSNAATTHITILNAATGASLGNGATVTVTGVAQVFVHYQQSDGTACLPQSTGCRASTVTCTSCVITATGSGIANEDCSGAIDISVGGTVVNGTITGTTTGACPDLDSPACGGTTSTQAGLWYTFVSPSTGFGNFSLCDSPFDSRIAVFEGTCDALTCVVGEDDDCGNDPDVTPFLQAGTTYFVWVGGFGATSAGDFSFAFVLPTCEVVCPADVMTTADAGVCGADVTIPVPVLGGACTGDATTVTEEAGPQAYAFLSGDLAATPTLSVPVVNLTAPGPVVIVITYTGDHDEAVEAVTFDVEGVSVTTTAAGFCATNTVTVTLTAAQYAVAAADGMIDVTLADNAEVNDNCPTSEFSVSITTPVMYTPYTTATTYADGTSSTELDPSGVFPVGVSTITFTSADVTGVPAECTMTVTVTDDEAPTLTCPNDIVINLGAGDCDAIVSYNPPASSDACGFLTLVPGTAMALDVGTATTQLAAGGGNMVNITNASTLPMQLSGAFDVHMGTGTTDVEVYYTNTGGYQGNAGTAGSWTQLGTAAGVTGAGLGAATSVNVAITNPLILAPGETRGLYVTNNGGAAWFYTNTAPTTLGDANLQITDGISLTYPFGITFDPRILNGSIGYELRDQGGAVQTAGLASGETFPIGTTVNTYTVTDVAGLSATCSFNVTVVAYTGAIATGLACNGNVNVSVDESCFGVVSADMILEGGPYLCYDLYTVDVNGTGNNVVGPGMVGQTLPVQVIAPDGNYCWGTITVEDKLAPVIACVDQEIACYDPLPTHPAPATPSLTASGGAGIMIPLAANTQEFDIEVSANNEATVADLNVPVDIDHTWVGDLVVTITSPSGTAVEIVNNVGGPGFGCNNDNMNITFDDEATQSYADLDATCAAADSPWSATGSYQPLNALSAFDGEPLAGAWNVVVQDLVGGDGGTINNIQLVFEAAGGSEEPSDACGVASAPELVSETDVDNGCTGAFQRTITRVWRTSDASGNTAECTQVINVTRATIADITLPGDVDLDCITTSTAIAGAQVGAMFATDVNAVWSSNFTDRYYNPDPALTGLLVTGEPGGLGCFNIDYTREADVIIDICAGSYKVLRTFKLVDWCTSDVVDHVQIIKVLDTTGPVVDAIPAQTTGSNSAGCGGVFVAPTLGTDDCSGIASAVFTVNGTVLVTGSTVPVGTHTINYTVTDGCGNSTDGAYTLEVVDNFAPVAICDEHTVASIGSPTPGVTGDGTVTINAATFDDGSYDNCGQVYFKVRRMTTGGCNGINGDDAPTPPYFQYFGYQEWFDDSATFCCEDNTVMVIFRVYDVDPGAGPVEDIRHNQGGDLYGRYNDCMVEVTVQDKLAPVIICPQDKTINCTADASVAAQGDAQAFDNCSLATVTNSDISLLDDCGEGTIIRSFVATDDAGNSNSCTQFITVVNENPFLIVDTECRTFGFPSTGNTILIPNPAFDPIFNPYPEFIPVGPHSALDGVEWPCDIEIGTCGFGLLPGDLETNTNNNGVTNQNVLLDARPTLSPDACGNIGVGYEDLTLPIQGDACIKILRKWTIIDWCQYTVGNAQGDGIWEYVQVIKVINSQAPNLNCGNSDSYIENFEENCGGTYVNLFIDADDDCTPQADLTFSYSIENGNGTVINTGTSNNASDAFNNGDYKITWTVADGCGNEQVCVHDFTVVDAKKPTPVCLNGLATVIMPSSGAVTIWASDFESGSSFDNCTPYSGLQFSFSSDVTDTNMEFTCAMISSSNTVPVQIWVTDDSGNQDFCLTYILVQDPNGACGPTQTVAIGGIITEEGLEVEGVNVDLMGSNEPTIVTGANGEFDFGSMATPASPYVITPEKNINPTNGVTTFDLVLISQHILGTNPISSAYKMIAADANDSETITTFDIVVLRRLILQIDTQFPGTQKSWRFVDAAHQFASLALTDVFPFTETINADTNAGDNFIGVKIGDVNGSANPNQLLGTDTRTFDGDLVFQLEDKQVQAGEEFTVDFNAKDFNNTLGYQFTLGFDNNKVEFVDLATNLTKLSEANFGLTMLEEGIITTSWNSHEAVNVANDETVFSLTFTATEAVTISEILNINSRYTQSEAYNGSDLYDVAIAFNGQVVASDFALYQNTPNPFKDVTTIGFNLPTAATATLKVYDVSGKVLTLVEVEGAKGYNSVELNRSQLAATGVLYYQVETADHTATLKMILVD